MSHLQGQIDLQEAQEFKEDLNEDKEDDDHESNDEELYEKVDKPWVPRSWKTDYTDDIIKEIENSEVSPSRPLLKIQFIKKRKEFGSSYKLSDKDANEPPLEIRQIPDPTYSSYVKKKTLEIGLQGSNSNAEIGVQTTWYRKINTVTETIQEDLQIEIEEDDKSLIALVKNAEIMNELEAALQQNEMIDIFKDDFAVLPQEELNASEATKLTHDIVELKSVSYHTISGKRVSCIRVMPKLSENSPRFACVCYRDNLNFDEKMELFTRSMKYTILLWDIDDVSSLQPVLEIQSPMEITTFEFHPKNYNMIIGGSTNGQLIRWDLEKGIRESGILNKKGKNAKQESDNIPVVRPYRYSALPSVSDPGALTGSVVGEIKKLVASHKSTICAIQWIPKEFEVEKRGLHHTGQNKSSGEQYQFVSLGEDGQVLIWDLRFPPEKEVSQGDYQWKAMFAVQLFRPDGMMGGSHIVFQRTNETPLMIGTSDEGELFTFDWTQRSTEENPKVEFVTKLWQNERNSRPCAGLEISPFFADIVLTLHDYHFCIWKLDTDFPIFTSPFIENAHITCGCWSPTRPGVIIIGRSDGYLDFWDLTDQSHTYIMHHLVVSVGISTLQFQNETPKRDTLNIGDNEGSLRVFVLPQNLSKPSVTEKEVMRQFFEREVKRVEYFRARFELRKEEAAAKKPEEEESHEEDKKVLNIEEEEERLEKEYQSFVTQWIDEVIEGKPPKQKEDGKKN